MPTDPRPRTDPRSPVQPDRSLVAPAAVGIFLLALLIWFWTQPSNQDPNEDVSQEETALPSSPPTPRTGSEETARGNAFPPVERARGTLASLFTTDDYPEDAIRRDEQGTVAFRLHVNPGGRVDRCEIVASSGYRSLDERTCAILQRRARFTPARASDGEPVKDEITGRIRWVLPEV